jgi:hypothetical protein
VRGNYPLRHYVFNGFQGQENHGILLRKKGANSPRGKPLKYFLENGVATSCGAITYDAGFSAEAVVDREKNRYISAIIGWGCRQDESTEK